jgi:hypothetical protein
VAFQPFRSKRLDPGEYRYESKYRSADCSGLISLEIRIPERRLPTFLASDAPGETTWDTLLRFSYFRSELPRATQTLRLTNYDWLKRKLLRNALRTATRVIFPARRTADCQDLASRNARLRQHRAKLAAASLNRSRLALIVVEADSQVAFTSQETGRSGAPNPRGRHFRATLGAHRQPAKCTVLGVATRDLFRHDKARLSKL